MGIMDLIMNYVVPVVSGVFVLFFISLFGYILHRAVLKPFGVYGRIKNLIITFRKKKLLQDERLIEYCVVRINKGWKEPKVREELLLANKYTSKRIDEIIYVFNNVRTEILGADKKIAEDLP